MAGLKQENGSILLYEGTQNKLWESKSKSSPVMRPLQDTGKRLRVLAMEM